MEEVKKEIEWRAFEYVYHKKSVDWYWYFGLVVLILTVFSIYLKNILFAFIILFAAFIMVLYAQQKPRIVKYKATQKNISFDDVSYSYQDIKFFWIVNDKKKLDEKILLLQLKKSLSTIIIIPIEDGKVDNIRTFLLSFLEEKELPIPGGYIFMNIIGF